MRRGARAAFTMAGGRRLMGDAALEQGNPFSDVFAALRDVMISALSETQRIDEDVPGSLVVKWREGAAIDDGMGGWFGTVTIKKAYVAYHLMPLYGQPALAEGLSDKLAKRRQGKTCFNFKRVDPALFEELASLTVTAAQSAR